VGDYTSSEWTPEPHRARSAIAVPLAAEDATLGVLHLFANTPDAFDARASDFAISLADEAALAVANARRYQAQLEANQQLRMRAERMDRIFEVGELFQ